MKEDRTRKEHGMSKLPSNKCSSVQIALLNSTQLILTFDRQKKRKYMEGEKRG